MGKVRIAGRYFYFKKFIPQFMATLGTTLVNVWNVHKHFCVCCCLLKVIIQNPAQQIAKLYIALYLANPNDRYLDLKIYIAYCTWSDSLHQNIQSAMFTPSSILIIFSTHTSDEIKRSPKMSPWIHAKWQISQVASRYPETPFSKCRNAHTSVESTYSNFMCMYINLGNCNVYLVYKWKAVWYISYQGENNLDF